ncbi:MAG: 50S ribosomal protein L13 [Candidatus Aenigmarchaeota archaeon]|nr:50S ribosomal protein L13 [Candidatus Aenigmarchaeota archaeon]
MKVIDATGKVCGRLASSVAKMLLNGEEVSIINAEKAVISGSLASITSLYKVRLDRGDKHKGPFVSRLPDRMMKRTVRGMLPYKKSSGREALRRLKVFVGTPKEFGGKVDEMNTKTVSSLTSEHITLHDLSKKLGRKPVVGNF